MKHEVHDLNVPASVANGTAKLVQDLREKYVQFSGTFVATMDIEGSMDGTNWATTSTGHNASAIVSVPQSVKYIRIATTAFTSGTPVAKLGAFQARSDGG